MTPIDLTRRTFLQGAAAVVGGLALPFGLKEEDLEPIEPEGRYRLEPLEVLVCLAEVEQPDGEDRIVSVYAFLDEDGPVDDVPAVVYRIRERTCFTIRGFYGVTFSADPDVRVRVRRVTASDEPTEDAEIDEEVIET